MLNETFFCDFQTPCEMEHQAIVFTRFSRATPLKAVSHVGVRRMRVGTAKVARVHFQINQCVTDDLLLSAWLHGGNHYQPFKLYCTISLAGDDDDHHHHK